MSNGHVPSVFVFDSFAEAHMAYGRGFTPGKHQATLANDLVSLPQFLCRADAVVLLAKRPTVEFLGTLKQAGFPLPEFVELKEGRIDPASSLCQRKIGRLRPWAWGPDSLEPLEPLFAKVTGQIRTAGHRFNGSIARSKTWSAAFLKAVLAQCREGDQAQKQNADNQSRFAPTAAEPWLCTEHEAGVAVDAIEGALDAIDAIRQRGYHRVVAKEANGLAGHNAVRLWEPEVSVARRHWLARALDHGRQLVVEPWRERALDFSIQLEMGPRKLKLCGDTGLINDTKGQFQANWAAANYDRCLPATVVALFPEPADISGRLQRLYDTVIALLEVELQRAGFVGPVGIDAVVYRTTQGGYRLKPVVEINPRYTMGRLTVERMKRTCAGSCGLFRLVSRAQALREGCADFAGYARSLTERLPSRLEGEPVPRIREGALCLNDPAPAQVCLTTFHVSRVLSPSLCK
jgi:hypothetical protein